MATSTPNLNLILPDYSDKADISVLNDNFQKIDEYCANGGGAGTVTSVNKVAPDATGNVTLTAANVGALPSGGTAKDSEKLGGKAPEYYATDEFVSQLKDHKADVIIDTTERAIYHELHAQDGEMFATLYGKTTETGTGDKSPDNPYTIRGVDEAQIKASGRNLVGNFSEFLQIEGVTVTKNSDGSLTLNGTVSVGVSKYATYSNDYKLLAGEAYTIFNADALPANCWLSVNNSGLMLNRLTQRKSYSPEEDIPARLLFVLNAGAVFKNFRLAPIVVHGTDSAVTYEPYTANVITPALLPDGAPLHGNGTVDDTVENDVLSGCDKKIVLDGTNANWSALDYSKWTTYAAVYTQALGDVAAGYQPYSNNIPGKVSANATNLYQYIATHNKINGYFYLSLSLETLGIKATSDINTVRTAINAYLAANPLTVYYRSTDYTPEKDLRVCKVVRKWTELDFAELTGWAYTQTNPSGKTVYASPLLRRKPKASNAVLCNILNTVVSINSSTPCIYLQPHLNAYGEVWLVLDSDDVPASDLGALKTWIGEKGIKAWYQLATPETYMTDPLALRKPTGIMPATVTGSAETAVAYPCDTKSYIDRKFDALAAALLS